MSRFADIALLESLLTHRDRLEGYEERIISQMLEVLVDGSQDELTMPQRKLAQDMATRKQV